MTAAHAKNLQKAVVQERMKVVHEMMQKMRTNISHVVQTLYKDFEDSFRAQRENIIADFNQIMRSLFIHFQIINLAEIQLHFSNKNFSTERNMYN